VLRRMLVTTRERPCFLHLYPLEGVGGADGGIRFRKCPPKSLLTDFELRENRHSESYNFREGTHTPPLPVFF